VNSKTYTSSNSSLPSDTNDGADVGALGQGDEPSDSSAPSQLKRSKTIAEVSSDINTARNLFRKFDIDDSGFLDKQEIAAILKELGMESSRETVDQLLKLYDVDGTGTVEEEEFTSFLTSVNQAATLAEKNMN